MEDIKLIYPNYEEIILINYFTSSVLKKNNDKGKFIFENNILKINWNKNEKEELFIKDDKVLDDFIYSYLYIENNEDKNDTIIENNEIINKKNNEKNNEKINENINKNNIEGKICNNKKINIFFGTKVFIYLIEEENNRIINIDDKSIEYSIKVINDVIINIKLNNEYYTVFELIDDIYYDSTSKFNQTFEIKHNEWNDFIILNEYNNYLYRLSDSKECASFELNNDELIIYWKKWDSEIFIKKNNIYNIKNIEKNNENINEENDEIIDEIIDEQFNEIIDDNIHEEIIDNKIEDLKQNIYKEENEEDKKLKEIYIYHSHWDEICIIENDKIFRVSNKNEYGNYEIKNNILKILWKLWDPEIFYNFNDLNKNNYYYEKYIKNLEYYNNKYFINTYNNNIYDSDHINIGKFSFKNKKVNIIFDDSEEKSYDFIEHNDSIIIYESIFKEIILLKDFEEKYILNLINYRISDKNNIKCGTYTLNNDIINIFWDNLTINEVYIYDNDKYYYDKYYEINNSIFYLFDDSDYKCYKIDAFNKFFYSDDNFTKIKFLTNNDYYYLVENNIFKTYLLNNINYENIKYNILINNDIIDNINDNFDYLIYKEFNKSVRNMDILQLYNHWIKYGINENTIYSLKSFLYNNDFFDINQYIINNNLKNSNEALIHFNNNNLLSDYFYSKMKIEVVYNNIFRSKKIEKSNIIEEDYLEEIFYDNDLLYVLNINNENDLDKFIYSNKYLNNINIIIAINFQSVKLIKFKKNIINKYHNLILIKSRNINNYYILEFIIKYLLENNIYYNKIIYVNNFDEIIDFENQNLILSNNKIIIKNNSILKLFIKKNYFYYLIPYCYFKNNILLVLIFYYLLKRNIYNITNSNFVSKFNTIKNIVNNNFSNKIILLK
jgi:hypothetical protein